MMKNERFVYNRIAPKLRPGESLGRLSEGFIHTRVCGEIVFVSAAEPGDIRYGESPYTVRQLREIDGIKRTIMLRRKEQKAAVQEAESIIFIARIKMREEVKNHDNPC